MTTADPQDTTQTEAFECPCDAPASAHCQQCWSCPGGHEDMCGW